MAIQTITLDPAAQGLEDQFVKVRNETGGGLAEGDLVYISGWDESTARWLVDKSQAKAINAALAQFILRAAIADATDGQAHKSYRLTGQDTSLAAVGDPVFLSSSVAGGFTFTSPPFARQITGRVAVINAVTGEIELFIQAETDAGFIRSNPNSGEFPVRSLNRKSDGTIEIEYDDVAAP